MGTILETNTMTGTSSLSEHAKKSERTQNIIRYQPICLPYSIWMFHFFSIIDLSVLEFSL